VATNEKTIKIGQLLVKTGCLQPGDVVEAIQVSKRVQIPIGRVLIASGLVTEDFLQTALHAQLLIRDGLISVEQAVLAMKLMTEEETTLKDALQKLNLSPQFSADTAFLAELLLDSNIVTEEQVEAALASSSESGIPLSGALVLQGTVSQGFFPNLLRAQQQFKSQVPRDTIIEELKASFLVWLKAEESLTQDFAENTDRLQRDDRIEKYIESEEAESAKTKTNGKKDTAALRTDEHDQHPDTDHELEAAPRLVDVLKSAGVINQAEIQRAWEKMLDDPIVSGRVFHAIGLLDEPTLQLSVRSQNLIKKRLLTFEEAVRAVRAARSGVITFEDALVQEVDSDRARYFDKSWRKSTLARAIGGAVVGVIAAGLMFGRRR
jgi:hypothetical protein